MNDTKILNDIALWLAKTLHESGAENMEYTLEGFQHNGVVIGDFKLTVEKLSNPQ